MLSSLNWEKWNKARLSRRQFICQGAIAKLVLFVESIPDWTWRLCEEGEKAAQSGNFAV